VLFYDFLFFKQKIKIKEKTRVSIWGLFLDPGVLGVSKSSCFGVEAPGAGYFRENDKRLNFVKVKAIELLLAAIFKMTTILKPMILFLELMQLAT
jgi:hypothetical protein